MAYYRADIKSIVRNIATNPTVAKVLREEMQANVEVAVSLAQKDLLDAFDKHPVNIEIGNGPTGAGRMLPVKGDLFSFIGFEAGSEPVKELRQVFEKTIRVRVKKYFSNGDIQFEVQYPSPEAIIAVSKMPWAPGLSWAEEIERGIPGIGSYLSITGYGRSGGGVQVQRASVDDFQSDNYLTGFYNTFVNSLSNINLRFL